MSVEYTEGKVPRTQVNWRSPPLGYITQSVDQSPSDALTTYHSISQYLLCNRASFPTMPPTNSVHSLKEIDAEKHEMVPIEVARGQNEHISAVDADFLAGFTNEQRRRVLRKVDWRLVPMLLILYLISFIDRANIGTSRLASSTNMTADKRRQRQN